MINVSVLPELLWLIVVFCIVSLIGSFLFGVFIGKSPLLVENKLLKNEIKEALRKLDRRAYVDTVVSPFIGKPTIEEINGLTLEYDFLGGVDIKCGDFIYVHVNYNYQYICNSQRRALAENIARLISTGKIEP